MENNHTNWTVFVIVWIISLAIACVFLYQSLCNGTPTGFVVHAMQNTNQPDTSSTSNLLQSDEITMQKQDSLNSAQLLQPSEKKYTGNVGKLNAEFSLKWLPDGSIEGTYFYPNKKETTYELKGTNKGNGSIELAEYTNGKITANCSLQASSDCYIGTMNNTDGRKFDMKFCLSTSATNQSSNSSTSNSSLGTLTIQGSFVNVRLSPSTSAGIIMQLNTGDVCTILEKGKSELIGGKTDFWYKISCKDKEGWVFGAFTNIKNQ